MLIKILSVGINWWARSAGPVDVAHGCQRAYYNSTGVRCGGKIRRHWISAGLISFNGVVDFNIEAPEASIGETFVCSDLTAAFGGNRLVVQAEAANSIVPDCYLVVVSSNLHGQIDFTSALQKSAFSQAIAASQLRDQQETMLIMRLGDWVQTSRGFWQLHTPNYAPSSTGLVRIGETDRN